MRTRFFRIPFSRLPSRSWIRAVGIGATSSVALSAAVISRGRDKEVKRFPSLEPLSVETVPQSPPSAGRYLTRDFIADAAEKALPAVVHIGITASDFYHGAGSGFIIETGHVVTNYHVVAMAAQRSVSRYRPEVRVTVTLKDGRKYSAVVDAADPASDIALLRIVPKAGERVVLPAIQLGSSRRVRPGDWAIAVGSPLTAALANTVTAGIVSAVDRYLPMLDDSIGYLQLDTPIFEGNSGGPLLNADGEVIGINSMKVDARGATGLGFSIPIDVARPIIRELVHNGRVVRPRLGVETVSLTDEILQSVRVHLNVRVPDVNSGVLVVRVTPGSAAERAGMLPEDVIMKVDGEDVERRGQVTQKLGYERGKEHTVTVLRNGEQLTLSVVPDFPDSGL